MEIWSISPIRNANFAWVQNFIYHLAPTGIAGFVLANGLMSGSGVEGKIKEKIVDADFLVRIMSFAATGSLITLQFPHVCGLFHETKPMEDSETEVEKFCS